jgi:Gpi18-like mannosyltransferase
VSTHEKGVAKFVAVYVIGALISAVTMTGWFFAELDYIWASNKYPEWQQKKYRKSLGKSIPMALAYSVMWPVGLPVAYSITGFAERGWAVNPQKWNRP